MKIENSHSVIKIRFDGFLSSLVIEKPKVLDWPDHGGTCARYYACLPYTQYENEVLNDVEGRMSSIKSIQDLKDSGFLNLLETGEYEFEIWKEKPTTLLYNTNLLNSNATLYKWHNEQVGTHRVAKPYSLNSFYPYGRQLMFSQPFESLDSERVQFYENKIRKGERPVAISLRVKNAGQDDEESYQDTDYNTTKYILDGHHKLVAYQNLKINPTYIVINRIDRGIKNEFAESFLPKLNPYLFYYQIEDIVNNGIGTMRHSPSLTKYIDDYIKDSIRIEDTLVRMLYNSVYYKDYETNVTRQNWFKGRLNKLIDRIDNGRSEFHYGYYSVKDNRRIYVRVNKWSEIKALMIKEL